MPKNAETEVQRKRELKKSIFIRTRVAVMALVMVLSLSISGTLAYLTYSANATPNRLTVAQDVGVQIVESTNYANAEYSDGSKFHDATSDGNSANKADLGAGNKSASLTTERHDSKATGTEAMRVTVLPEAELLDEDGTTVLGNAFLEENWSAPTQEDSKWCMKNNLFKVYLADDWQSNYVYVDGAFVYNKTLGKGETAETLVTGSDWVGDAKLRLNYGTIKINVIAEATMATETSLDPWGVQVDSDGNITKKS